MRTSFLLAATLGLLSCGSDFRGEKGIYAFDTTLSRPSVGWTPATPIALGESFTVRQGFDCFVGCPDAFTRALVQPPNGVLIGDPLVLVTAGFTGTTSVVTNTNNDLFHVVVVEAAGLRLADPLEYSRPRWKHLLNLDGGPAPFPDVGDEELVIGADAGLYIDITLIDSDGGTLASRAGFAAVSTGSDTTATIAALDARMLDVQSGPVGTAARTTITRLDGGFSRSWNIRTAGPEEIASIELVQISPSSNLSLVRAIVRRPDGGVFFEPHLDWSFEGVTEDDYVRYRGDLRQRSDLRLFKAVYDGGTPRATVTANGITTTLVLDAFESEPEPTPAPPMMMMRPKMGCTTAGLPLLGCALLLALRRRQRAK